MEYGASHSGPITGIIETHGMAMLLFRNRGLATMDPPSRTAVGAAASPSRALALIRRVAGPMWRRVGFTAVLTVPGRRSGMPRRVTLFPIKADGTWYLLSQYGETSWVRNLRAAGRGEVRIKGHSEAFQAVEVSGTERDRVIAAFVAMTPKPFRRDFDRSPDSADPTFRVEPIR